MQRLAEHDAADLAQARRQARGGVGELIRATDDELVEATPTSIRLRKKVLTENGRKKAGRSKTQEVVEV